MNRTEYLEQMRWESIKNDSEETCPAFGLLAITGSESRGRRTVLIGDKPSTTFYREYAVNGPTAIPAGKTGRCTRSSGGLWIKYDTGTPANGEGWGPKPSQWTASKGFPGITCEGIKDAGRYILLGTLGEIRTLLCKATAYLADGAVSSNFQIWSGTIASGANSGFTTLPSIELVQDIPTDRFFVAHWVNNGWVGRMLGGGTRLLKCKLNGDLDATDATATIDNVTSFSGEGAASPTSANNTLDLAGADNDDAVIIEDTSGASAAYYLLNVMHHDCEA
jgi:hypothetical protein